MEFKIGLVFLSGIVEREGKTRHKTKHRTDECCHVFVCGAFLQFERLNMKDMKFQQRKGAY